MEKYHRTWSDDPDRRVVNLDTDAPTGRALVWPTILACIAAACFGYSCVADAYSGCGMIPMKPMTPMGCRDLVATCVCDSRGQNCHWEWHCVE